MVERIANKDKVIAANERIKEREFWLENLSGELADCHFPYDYRTSNKQVNLSNVSIKLKEELSEKILKLANGSDLQLHMILTAGLTLLLNKYTRLQDICIGTPVLKQDSDTNLINTLLVLRHGLEEHMTFRQILQHVSTVMVNALENQNFPLESLQPVLSNYLPEGRNYPFRTAILLEEIQDLNYLRESNAEIIFSFRQVNGCIEGDMYFNEHLYKTSTITRFGHHFIDLLEQALLQPNTPHIDLDWVSDNDIRELMTFNQTELDYPHHLTVIQLFEEQVMHNPNKLAVSDDKREITYAQLKEKVDLVASSLHKKGIGKGHIVGLMMDRSIDAVIAMLGILKSGAAYLPINIYLPYKRIETMLKECKSPLCIVKPEVISEDFTREIQDCSMVSFNELLETELISFPSVSTPYDLAYVIFTSGTTGNPKGIMVENRSVVNLIFGLKNEIYDKYSSSMRIGLVSPFEFDASVQNMFGALLLGNSLFIVPEEARTDGQELINFYQEKQINIADGTPMHLRLLTNFIDEEVEYSFKHFIIAGEELPPKLARKFLGLFNENCRPNLTNAYGPTETTVDSTCYHVQHAELEFMNQLPIGRPLANQKVYIMGDNQQLQPVGIPGELCISGEGLARGYLNQPKLTMEKFVPIQINKEGSSIIDDKVYRTGDLARWLPDGNLEYLGRMDDQVKIRGLRIELGEIEKQLLRYPEIGEAIVITRKKEGEDAPVLCAYVVMNSSAKVEEVRQFLREYLPFYMIPAYIIPIEQFPISSNGKIDRKALPDPIWEQSTTLFIEPRNEIEQMLSEIWKVVLGIEKIGVNDNFFELGGNSLQITSVVSHIYKRLGVDVPIREMFQRPTIMLLAEYIEKYEGKKNYSQIEIVPDREFYQASSSQKRLYILNRFAGIGTAYNIPGAMLIEGEFDFIKAEQCVKELVERHELLRTSFQFIKGEPVQFIHDSLDIRIEHLYKSDRSTIEELIQEFIRPFQLDRAPLMRVGLMKLEFNQYLLLFDLHHIIADGVSLAKLEKEFIDLYSGKALEPIKIQYKDYANWQTNRLHDEGLKEIEEYWVEKFKGELPILMFPTDKPRGLNQTFEGDRLVFHLTPELSNKLKSFADEREATLYMVLLSSLNIVLHVYTQQEDIIVGSPIAGRIHHDLEPIIGMFVNTLPMRNHPKAEKTIIQFLNEVKENALEAFQYQEYPFDELVNKLDMAYHTNRNPVFDVMLVMQNIGRTSEKIKDITFKSYEIKHQASKVDMSIEVFPEEEGLRLELEYATGLYYPQTIERFMMHFINTLEWMVANPEAKIEDVNVLSKSESTRMLNKLNNTKLDFTQGKLVHQFFEDQVENKPEEIAVISNDIPYSYSYINNRANQLARILRQKGVDQETKIGIVVERSVEMIIAIFAALKSGAAYVPIDPEYPKRRMEHILEDCNPQFVLTESKYVGEIPFVGEIIDLKQENLYVGDTSNLEVTGKPNNLAYILYTSGSTGRPKGVMIEHCSIVNFLFSMTHLYPMDESDTYLLKTPYIFDVSVLELFGWTIVGSKLVIMENGEHRNPRAILRTIDKYDVKLLNFVPSMFRAFVNTLNNENCQVLNKVKYILLAGEALTHEVVNKFKKHRLSTQIENMYGPTEATVIASTFSLQESENYNTIPIGKPIPNVRLYILNQKQRLQPIGAVGELYIAGEGLARGYVNQMRLTEEKFLPDPFVKGEKMYRTGDLSRWLPDGNIEFLGRNDEQLKIRGYRIEPGEILDALSSHHAIKEAVIVDIQDEDGQKKLVAYFVAKSPVSISDLKLHLAKLVPSYMIPTFFVEVENIPLTPSGKVDRHSLPSPRSLPKNEEESMMSPSNELESRLVEIWKSILKIEVVGVEDDFFDLGGNSLLAIELDLALENENLNTDDLVAYTKRNIKQLAAYIAEKKNN